MKKFLKKLFYRKIGNELKDCKTVLDVGCGHSSMLEKFPRERFESTGIDKYAPYIEAAKAKNIFDHYIVDDITTHRFLEQSFDAVIGFGIIEHLEKKDSVHLVNNVESWAKKKIILEFPNGFLPTLEEHLRGNEELDELQRHKCGWTAKELRAKGYSVRGVNGLKWARSLPGGNLGLLNKLCYPLTYFFPSLAYELLAIKTLES